jgi:4-hydroxy-3-methylbut-2-en-1-yl diphosphate synthase IspG/GcpE
LNHKDLCSVHLKSDGSQINVDKGIFPNDLRVMKRRKTRKVWVGKVAIGGGAPISVQSMTKTDTRDVSATIRQIKKLERVGCEIIRVAVPDMEAANVLPQIKRKIKIPLVADIHFDYRLALKAVDSGGQRDHNSRLGKKNSHKNRSKCRFYSPRYFG